MNIHEKYNYLLNKHNITNYKISKDTGISITTLRYFKIGKSILKIDKLKIIAKYFNVPLDYFLEEKYDSKIIPLNKDDEVMDLINKLDSKNKETALDFIHFLIYKKDNK